MTERTTLLPITVFLIASLLLLSCGSDSTGPKEQQPELTKAKAVTAISEVFRDRGLYSNSSEQMIGDKSRENSSSTLPSFDSYFDAEYDSESGRVDVSFDIGPEGGIIPNGSWRDSNPDHCREKIRYMKGAKKKLNYKVFSFNDGWNVFVQYIDVGTGEVENQREGQDADPGLEGLKDAIDNSMDNFEPDIKPATGPCGEKFPLKLVLTSNTTIEGIYDPQNGTNNNIVVEDQVRAEIALAYNEQKHAYEGSGKLNWSKYDVRFPESPNTTASCQLPASAGTGIPKFYDGTEDSLAQGNRVLYVQPQQWGFPLATCTVTYPDGSSVTQSSFFKAFPITWSVLEPPRITRLDGPSQLNVYEIKNWEDVSGSEEIIARRTFSRTETADTLGFKTYNEETTMEIKRND